jgi:hypothetical protein
VGQQVVLTCDFTDWAIAPAGGLAQFPTANGLLQYPAEKGKSYLVKAGPQAGPDKQSWLGVEIGQGHTGWQLAKCFTLSSGRFYKVNRLNPTPSPTPLFTIGKRVVLTCADWNFRQAPPHGYDALVYVNATGSHAIPATKGTQWTVTKVPVYSTYDNLLWVAVDTVLGDGWLPDYCYQPALVAHPVQMRP